MSAALLVGCSGDEPTEPADAPPAAALADAVRSSVTYCGIEVGPGQVEDYRRRLTVFLGSAAPAAPADLYSASFALTGSPPLTRRDWRRISDQWAIDGDLKEAGWRACFLGDGWVGLQANETGAIGLSSFDRHRAFAHP